MAKGLTQQIEAFDARGQEQAKEQETARIEQEANPTVHKALSFKENLEAEKAAQTAKQDEEQNRRIAKNSEFHKNLDWEKYKEHEEAVEYTEELLDKAPYPRRPPPVAKAGLDSQIKDINRGVLKGLNNLFFDLPRTFFEWNARKTQKNEKDPKKRYYYKKQQDTVRDFLDESPDTFSGWIASKVIEFAGEAGSYGLGGGVAGGVKVGIKAGAKALTKEAVKKTTKETAKKTALKRAAETAAFGAGAVISHEVIEETPKVALLGKDAKKALKEGVWDIGIGAATNLIFGLFGPFFKKSLKETKFVKQELGHKELEILEDKIFKDKKVKSDPRQTIEDKNILGESVEKVSLETKVELYKNSKGEPFIQKGYTGRQILKNGEDESKRLKYEIYTGVENLKEKYVEPIKKKIKNQKISSQRSGRVIDENSPEAKTLLENFEVSADDVLEIMTVPKTVGNVKPDVIIIREKIIKETKKQLDNQDALWIKGADGKHRRLYTFFDLEDGRKHFGKKIEIFENKKTKGEKLNPVEKYQYEIYKDLYRKTSKVIDEIPAVKNPEMLGNSSVGMANLKKLKKDASFHNREVMPMIRNHRKILGPNGRVGATKIDAGSLATGGARAVHDKLGAVIQTFLQPITNAIVKNPLTKKIVQHHSGINPPTPQQVIENLKKKGIVKYQTAEDVLEAAAEETVKGLKPKKPPAHTVLPLIDIFSEKDYDFSKGSTEYDPTKVEGDGSPPRGSVPYNPEKIEKKDDEGASLEQIDRVRNLASSPEFEQTKQQIAETIFKANKVAGATDEMAMYGYAQAVRQASVIQNAAKRHRQPTVAARRKFMANVDAVGDQEAVISSLLAKDGQYDTIEHARGLLGVSPALARETAFEMLNDAKYNPNRKEKRMINTLLGLQPEVSKSMTPAGRLSGQNKERPKGAGETARGSADAQTARKVGTSLLNSVDTNLAVDDAFERG